MLGAGFVRLIAIVIIPLLVEMMLSGVSSTMLMFLIWIIKLAPKQGDS